MSKVWLSAEAGDNLRDAFTAEGHILAFTGPSEAVSEPVSCHADIFMCKLGAEPKSPVFHGDESALGPVYPSDVLYNAVVTERFMICNPKTVSAELFAKACELYPEIEVINVRQGYTKCNLVVVDESHFITEDEGIYNAVAKCAEKLSEMAASGKACKKTPECLLVRPGFVKLSGYSRGFIGGASGRIGNELWFNGDISQNPDFERVSDLVKRCGLKLRYIPGQELTDIGSIIEEA